MKVKEDRFLKALDGSTVHHVYETSGFLPGANIHSPTKRFDLSREQGRGGGNDETIQLCNLGSFSSFEPSKLPNFQISHYFCRIFSQ